MKTTRAPHFKHFIAALVAITLVCAANVRAQQIVVPSGWATTEGVFDNGYPFNLQPFGASSLRYQQIYASSLFSTLGGPVLITQMAFRPDYQYGTAFSSTISNIQINMSTIGGTPNGLSTIFAANVGANDQVVFGPGPLSLSSAFTGPALGPKNFDILISLTTPFLYNPSNGNLLLDVRNFSGGATTQFDADAFTGNIIRRAASASANGVNDAAGFADTVGLITRFQFVPVPEPASVLLLGIGLLPLLSLAKRHRTAPR